MSLQPECVKEKAWHCPSPTLQLKCTKVLLLIKASFSPIFFPTSFIASLLVVVVVVVECVQCKTHINSTGRRQHESSNLEWSQCQECFSSCEISSSSSCSCSCSPSVVDAASAAAAETEDIAEARLGRSMSVPSALTVARDQMNGKYLVGRNTEPAFPSSLPINILGYAPWILIRSWREFCLGVHNKQAGCYFFSIQQFCSCSCSPSLTI